MTKVTEYKYGDNGATTIIIRIHETRSYVLHLELIAATKLKGLLVGKGKAGGGGYDKGTYALIEAAKSIGLGENLSEKVSFDTVANLIIENAKKY